MALDQQRLTLMFGKDDEECDSVGQFFDADQFDAASGLLQTMDTLDLVLLVTSNINRDFNKTRIFRSASIKIKFWMLNANTNTV